MLPVELKNLIDKYCMGIEPTDGQVDEIFDKIFALGADMKEANDYIEKMKAGPTAEELAEQKAAEKIRLAKEEAEAKAKAEAAAAREAERKSKEAAAAKARAEAEKARAEAEEAKAAEMKARADAELASQNAAKARAEEMRRKAENERIANRLIRISDIVVTNKDYRIQVRPFFDAYNYVRSAIQVSVSVSDFGGKALMTAECPLSPQNDLQSFCPEIDLSSKNKTSFLSSGIHEAFVSVVICPDGNQNSVVSSRIPITFECNLKVLGTSKFMVNKIGSMEACMVRLTSSYTDKLVDQCIGTYLANEGGMRNLTQTEYIYASSFFNELSARSPKAAWLSGLCSMKEGCLQEAYEKFKTATARGEKNAYGVLGNVAEMLGYNKEAVDAYEAACSASDYSIIKPMAALYHGCAEVKNDKRAYELYSWLVKNGDKESMVIAGYSLYHGLGVSADPKAGKALLHKAVDEKVDGAKKTLVSILETELEAWVDYHGHFSQPSAEELSDFQDLVKDGESFLIPLAQFYKGLMLQYGIAGMNQNLASAQDRFYAACSGCDLAGWFVGMAKLKEGKKYEKAEAAERITKAATAGLEEARLFKALEACNAEGVHPDIFRWVNIFEHNEPYPDSAPAIYFCLGEAYRYGAGVERNQETAVSFYAKSASLGYSDAMLRLAYAYYFGSGIDHSIDAAYELFRKAADQESSAAQKFLKNNKLPAQISGDDKHYPKKKAGYDGMVNEYNGLASQLGYDSFSTGSQSSFPYHQDGEIELKYEDKQKEKLHSKMNDLYIELISSAFELGL